MAPCESCKLDNVVFEVVTFDQQERVFCSQSEWSSRTHLLCSARRRKGRLVSCEYGYQIFAVLVCLFGVIIFISII